MVRVIGLEPTRSAWKADMLAIKHHTRVVERRRIERLPMRCKLIVLAVITNAPWLRDWELNPADRLMRPMPSPDGYPALVGSEGVAPTERKPRLLYRQPRPSSGIRTHIGRVEENRTLPARFGVPLATLETCHPIRKAVVLYGFPFLCER